MYGLGLSGNGTLWWFVVSDLYFHFLALLLLQLSHFSRPTLWDPIDGSPPGSSVLGILQERILEWVSISFSKNTILIKKVSIQFSHSVVSDSLQSSGLQHARPPCPSPTFRVYSNSCPLSWWCHPTISFSVVPFSSHLQFFPASGSFQMSQFFTSGGQSIGVSISTSVLPMNIRSDFL